MSLAVVPLISSIFNLVREGKQTVDEVVNDPAVQESANKFSDQVIAETMQGDTFTKRARPTLIYIAALALFNDLIIAPYVDVFTSEDVTVLTGDKFDQLIYLLMALGVARSVLDKQGNWVKDLLNRLK